MNKSPKNGVRTTIAGKERIYYDGYWIRYYAPPEDTLTARKELIDHLTRRTFHHTESGINTPGERLEVARAAYESETDPERKRVNAAMLAGALFNRATDIFTTVVELAEKGVKIKPSNELMRTCGRCFKEALDLGKQVRHYSGHEGIDELWGEPLKVFTMPIAAFYESRYRKIAQTMRDIDRIAEAMCVVFADDPGYAGMLELVKAYAESAKDEAETMRCDPEIFQVWPRFVAAGEILLRFRPQRHSSNQAILLAQQLTEELDLINAGKSLIGYLSGARVPMPKSLQEYLQRCDTFRSGRKLPMAASS